MKHTRSEKREERLRRSQTGPEDDEVGSEDDGEPGKLDYRHEVDLSVEELKGLQATDPTLQGLRKAAEVQSVKSGLGFFQKDGLLYRRWVPRGRDREEMSVEQLVLPQQCRETVMRLAHSIPLAGHLGKNKTISRVLQRFYWPTVYRDIAKFCRRCAACQKTGRKVHRAPLIPLPTITQPFSRIAMDIVGPLQRSRSARESVCASGMRLCHKVSGSSCPEEH